MLVCNARWDGMCFDLPLTHACYFFFFFFCFFFFFIFFFFFFFFFFFCGVGHSLGTYDLEAQMRTS